jgi:hypothetical protein
MLRMACTSLYTRYVTTHRWRLRFCYISLIHLLKERRCVRHRQ